MIELDKLRAVVEYKLEQAIAIDWSNPKNLSPQGVALCNQMAALQIMMKPQNQMAMYQNMQRQWLRMWGLS
jgi:hypothetical protein